MNSHTESTFCFVIGAHKVVSLIFILEQLRNHSETQSCRFLPAVYLEAQLPFAAISHRGISGANSGDLSGPLCELCDQTPWPQHEATNILEHLIPRIFSDGNLLMLHDASVYVWKTTLTTLWIYSDYPWWLFPLPAAKLKLRLTLSMAYLDLSHFWVHKKSVENSWSLGLTQKKRPAFHQW